MIKILPKSFHDLASLNAIKCSTFRASQCDLMLPVGFEVLSALSLIRTEMRVSVSLREEPSNLFKRKVC